MKEEKFTNFRLIACASVLLVWAVYADGAPYRNIYSARSADPDVNIDLEKLHAPRDARDLDSLEKLIDRYSQKWKVADQASFFSYMYEACGEISSYDYSDRSKQARLLTRYSLEVLDSGPLSLEHRVPFVEFLSSDAPDQDEVSWRHLRFQKANIFLDTWRQFASRMDPAFDASEVPMINIDPPADSMVPSGASPEAIKDTTLRAEYERNLAANRKKVARIAEQQYLRMNADQFHKLAERYLVNAYSKPPPDLVELDRLLTEKGIDPTVRASILQQVSEHN